MSLDTTNNIIVAPADNGSLDPLDGGNTDDPSEASNLTAATTTTPVPTSATEQAIPDNRGDGMVKHRNDDIADPSLTESAPLPTNDGGDIVTDGENNLIDPALIKQPEPKAASPGSHKHSHLTKSSLATQAIHGDDFLNRVDDVAPPIHVATTFRYAANSDDLKSAKERIIEYESETFTPEPFALARHNYSRVTAPNTTRLESLLTTLLDAPALTYSSGIAALHAAYIFLNPRRVSIGGGYHGSHGVLAIHKKISGTRVLGLNCKDEELEAGDVVHLETPINPTGEAFNIAHYAHKAHSRGAYLLVDSTFAPPPLQDPFAHGADIVLHSGTKYIGGHSDLLAGVLATRNIEWIRGLAEERTYLGSVMGGLEGWLGIRSVRTLELRVRRQSENAEKLVAWLNEVLTSYPNSTPRSFEATSGSVVNGTKGLNTNTDDNVDDNNKANEAIRSTVSTIHHASLQLQTLSSSSSPSSSSDTDTNTPWLKKQMPNGFGPVFALIMKSEQFARCLPSKLHLFQHATSLGGVESLIEWRAMSDPTADTRLLRISVGVEDWEDLKEDLVSGLRGVCDDEVGRGK